MSEEFLDDLMPRIDEGGLALTGEGGFLPEHVKAVLDRGMTAELYDGDMLVAEAEGLFVALRLGQP